MNSFGMPLRSMDSEVSPDHYFQSVPHCGTPSLFSILYSLFTSPARLRELPYFRPRSQAWQIK